MRDVALRLGAIGLGLLALAGCASGGVEDVEARLGQLVGVPEAELVRRLGVPQRVHDADGRRFLAYVEYWPAMPSPRYAAFGMGGWHRGGMGMGFGYSIPPSSEKFCEATFEVNAGRVAGFALRGTACGWSGWPPIQP